jgi:hypothetical protein
MMAKVIPFKQKKKLTTSKEYFDYAMKTGLCPLCGEVISIHKCNVCLTVEVKCTCNFNMERRV